MRRILAEAAGDMIGEMRCAAGYPAHGPHRPVPCEPNVYAGKRNSALLVNRTVKYLFLSENSRWKYR